MSAPFSFRYRVLFLILAASPAGECDCTNLAHVAFQGLSLLSCRDIPHIMCQRLRRWVRRRPASGGPRKSGLPRRHSDSRALSERASCSGIAVEAELDLVVQPPFVRLQPHAQAAKYVPVEEQPIAHRRRPSRPGPVAHQASSGGVVRQHAADDVGGQLQRLRHVHDVPCHVVEMHAAAAAPKTSSSSPSPRPGHAPPKRPDPGTRQLLPPAEQRDSQLLRIKAVQEPRPNAPS